VAAPRRSKDKEHNSYHPTRAQVDMLRRAVYFLGWPWVASTLGLDPKGVRKRFQKVRKEGTRTHIWLSTWNTLEGLRSLTQEELRRRGVAENAPMPGGAADMRQARNVAAVAQTPPAPKRTAQPERAQRTARSNGKAEPAVSLDTWLYQGERLASGLRRRHGELRRQYNALVAELGRVERALVLLDAAEGSTTPAASTPVLDINPATDPNLR
jgi:hypothetical protein